MARFNQFAGRTPENRARRYENRQRCMLLAAGILGGVAVVDGRRFTVCLADGSVLQRREARRRAAAADPARWAAGCKAAAELGRAERAHDAAKSVGSPRTNALRIAAKGAYKEFAVLTW